MIFFYFVLTFNVELNLSQLNSTPLQMFYIDFKSLIKQFDHHFKTYKKIENEAIKINEFPNDTSLMIETILKSNNNKKKKIARHLISHIERYMLQSSTYECLNRNKILFYQIAHVILMRFDLN